MARKKPLSNRSAATDIGAQQERARVMRILGYHDRKAQAPPGYTGSTVNMVSLALQAAMADVKGGVDR